MDALISSRIKKMSPQLLVADIERSIEFYTKKLGFQVDFRYEDFYAGIIKDGYSIHLKLDESSKQIERKRESEDVDIIFSVDNIEGLYEEISNRSVEFTQSLRDMAYGKEFYVADPDGHIIAFLGEP
jgi:catechol 2,3-dioxygenase-like lactoylglutathione lyase family enzyme